MSPRWRSQAQRNLDNARLAAEEEARLAAERERAAAQPPPDDSAQETPGDPPPPGEVSAASAADGGGQARAGEPAAAPSPPSLRDGPPPPEGEDRERNRLMGAWLREHFETVEAMARAGEAPVRPPPPEEEAPPDTEAPPPPPPVHVRRGDRWNKPKMAEFLRQLAATHSVTAAAKAVGMSPRSAHRLRARLKGQPFDIAWEAAFRHGYDDLAHSALELALEGEEVPHYHQGELVGTHRKRHPQLMIGLLKLRNQVGAPMLGRYGAAAEFWSENWDTMLQRVETGSVRWDDERDELGEEELKRLELPDARKEIDRIIARNLPDE